MQGVIRIKTVSFKGGIFPLHDVHSGKHLTRALPIEKLPAPEIAVYPMAQHIGAPCEPTVKKGDRVLIGQEIGAMKGRVSAPIHASVSGEVIAVEQRMTVSGSPVMSVVVKNDGKDEWAETVKERTKDEVDKLTSEKINDIIRECGIVGMGGASFPTHIKLMPPDDTPIDTIIVNGAECEPYLSSDHRIMLEQPEKVIGGLRQIMRAIGGDLKGVIAVEVNKKDAIKLLKEKISGEKGMSVASLEVKYPQGSEKHIIYSITKRKVQSGKLPASVGCIVVNVETAAAIYDAVYSRRPIVDTVITVSGEVSKPAVLSVRTGTPFQQMIDHCGGLKEGVIKVVSGGPMMGVALYDLTVPVVKSSSGVLAMKDHNVHEFQTHCIRCGRCTRACPMNLLPVILNSQAAKLDWEAADRFNALDCIECGCCTYVCPAKLNITMNIKAAKRAVLASRIKN